MKEKIKEWIFSVIGLTAGAALAAAALENFLIPFRILDGGLNGIGMIINFLTDIPLSIRQTFPDLYIRFELHIPDSRS